MVHGRTWGNRENTHTYIHTHTAERGRVGGHGARCTAGGGAQTEERGLTATVHTHAVSERAACRRPRNLTRRTPTVHCYTPVQQSRNVHYLRADQSTDRFNGLTHGPLKLCREKFNFLVDQNSSMRLARWIIYVTKDHYSFRRTQNELLLF